MNKLVIALILVAPSLAFADKNYEEGKGDTWDCKEDPVVNINHGGGTYKFTGDCSTININGGANKISIASVDSLNIFAGNNTITVGSVGTINITGAGNRVTWKHAKEGDAPDITDTGEGNHVGQKK